MLDVAQIELLEADRNYVKLTVGREIFLARSTLQSAEKSLQSSGRRPDRRERRHGQQDRDLHARRPRERERGPVLRRGAHEHDRPRLCRRFPDPDRGALRGRGALFCRTRDRSGRGGSEESRVRRDARPLHHGDRDRGGDLPSALRNLARRRGCARQRPPTLRFRPALTSRARSILAIMAS